MHTPPRESAGARLLFERRALVFTVPMLARALGISRFAMRRRLIEQQVPMQRRGAGAKVQHSFVTYNDLALFAPWVLDNIENWEALLTRAGARR